MPRLPLLSPAALAWSVALAAFALAALVAWAPGGALDEAVQFFRPHAACAFLLLAPALGCARRPGPALSAALAGLLLAWPVAVPVWPAAAPAARPTLRVLTFNVRIGNRDKQAFHDLVAHERPDVIALQEAAFSWRDLARSLPGYPHVVGYDGEGRGTVALVSRHPLAGGPVDGLPRPTPAVGGGAAVRAVLDGPNGRVTLYALHAPTPRHRGGLAARRAYLRAFAKAAATDAAAGPTVALGDWNTPVWSPLFAGTLRRGRLFAAERRGWPPATRLVLGPLGTPVDHVAVSRDLGVVALRHGSAGGSDHRPVIADLGPPTGPPLRTPSPDPR